MELDINFNQKIKPVIESSEALTDWFERNQFVMAYLELTHPGCTHLDNSMAHADKIALGRMANACLSWLESEEILPNEVRVANAIRAMDEVYQGALPYITKTAAEVYFIDTSELEKESGKGQR